MEGGKVVVVMVAKQCLPARFAAEARSACQNDEQFVNMQSGTERLGHSPEVDDIFRTFSDLIYSDFDIVRWTQ